MSQHNKILVLTGGSTGIGHETAELFAANGYVVYELSRSGCDSQGITHIDTDVTQPEAIKAALNQIGSEKGQIDLLICNAGFGISGAVEYTELIDAKRQFDVNFFGTTETVKNALPLLRKARGRIICTGSVAGFIPIPFQVYYSAAKAALGAFCEALRSEVRPFGISVCCILPGDVKTKFTGMREKRHSGDDLYGGRIARSVAVMEKDEQNGMTAAYVAQKVLKISAKKKIKPFYTIGFSYQLMSLAAKILPRSLVSVIVGWMYAK